MRRPWTWLLLLAFVTAQIYGLHRVVARHTRAPEIAKVSSVVGGILTRNGRQYLVSPENVYLLGGRDSHINLTTVSAAWADVPEPSGAGVWHILASQTGEVLMGLHGLVFGSPVGAHAVLVDPATRIPLVARTVKGPPLALSDYSVDRLVWSSVAPLAVFLGRGPKGTGFYSVSDVGAVTFLYPVTPATIASFGDDGANLSAVTTSGALVYQGQILQAMPEAPAWTMADGTILGWTKNDALWWKDGNLAGTVAAPLPNAKPVVPPGKLVAAYLIGTAGHEQLVILSPKHVSTIPFPYADARVVGWYHQAVLIAVTTGSNAGLYRVLVPKSALGVAEHGKARV